MPATALFTFDTTHMALWAEEVAGEAGIPVEVVPTPPGYGALCDLALEVRSKDVERLRRALTAATVAFYPPGP